MSKLFDIAKYASLAAVIGLGSLAYSDQTLSQQKSTSNSINMTNNTSTTKNNITNNIIKNINKVHDKSADTCDCEKVNCPPKYLEPFFLRKAHPTFSSKEVWTLDNGKGTDLLSIDCENPKRLENILEYVDFTDPKAKDQILSNNYTTIKDRAGREFIKIHTRIKGHDETRYFTIQGRDEESSRAISVNGTINYDILTSIGNKILRLYIELGKPAGKSNESGKLQVKSVNSGDILIPYFKCCEKPTPEIEAHKADVKTILETPKNYEPTLNEANNELHIIDSLQNIIEKMRSVIANNQVSATVVGGIHSQFTQKEDCDCNIPEMNAKPSIWEIAAYMQVDKNLQINSELRGIRGTIDFMLPNGKNIGNYSLTTAMFDADARINLWPIPIESAIFGIGISADLKYLGSTQNGGINNAGINHSLSGGYGDYSGFVGALLLLQDSKMSGNNLSAGGYVGTSNKLGNMLRGSLRVDDLEIVHGLSVDGYAYLDFYDGQNGKGKIGGVEARLVGPEIIGFIRPVIGYSDYGLLYFYDDGRIGTGRLDYFSAGIKADIGKLFDNK